jgi:DNA-binding transcriptional regulator YhcF (GntR family)
MFGFGLGSKSNSNLIASLRSKKGTLNANAIINALSKRTLTSNQRVNFNALKKAHRELRNKAFKKRRALGKTVYNATNFPNN